MGVERLAMLKYGINAITHFYDNDVRFLRQFLWMPRLETGETNSNKYGRFGPCELLIVDERILNFDISPAR
jgi:hypothetical protein